MQAAAPPLTHASTEAPTPAPEPLAAKLERLQSDALDVLHLVMLKAAESFTKPAAARPSGEEAGEEEDDNPAHTRAVTERMRLCLRAAVELLRTHPPGAAPRPRNTPRRRHADQIEHPAPAARMSADPTPPRPPELTDDDRRRTIECLHTKRPLPHALHDKLARWSDYARATSTEHPFATDPALLAASRGRFPWDGPGVPAQPNAAAHGLRAVSSLPETAGRKHFACS